MDTQEILSKIAKLKKAVESESDADVKASYNKKIAALEAQVAEAEAKVEKKEEKAASEEKKTLSEADEKIKKLEKALASESDPDVKARYQKKLNELKGTLKDVKEEIKEEKKEIAEQKKEIKQAVKEVKSVQKEVRKTAIKKVAAKKVERKKVETKKTKRKEKLNRVLSDLDAMIEKNKKLKSKYGSGYKGTGKPSDLERDAGRKAKPFGYRFVGKHDYRVPTEMQIKRGLKRGTIDYEARPNRADVNPDKKVKLAHGGNVKDSAVVAIVTSQKYDTKSKEFVGKERVENIKKGNEIFADAFKRHTPFAESTQEKLVKNAYEEYWNDGKSDEVIKVKKVEITADGRKPHHYADGGKFADGGELDWANDENEKLGNWLMKTKDGKEILQKSKNSIELEKNVRAYAEKNGEIAGLEIENEDEGLEWVTFDDLMNEIKSRYASGGKVMMEDGGMMRRGGRTKAALVADKRLKAKKAGRRISEDGNVYYESRENRSDANRKLKLKKGGKVGTSKEDRARYAKPAGWRWKDEAVTKRVIERKQLSMQPSKKMRDKYPDLVYYEDRLNKADNKPTRTSADSI